MTPMMIGLAERRSGRGEDDVAHEGEFTASSELKFRKKRKKTVEYHSTLDKMSEKIFQSIFFSRTPESCSRINFREHSIGKKLANASRKRNPI